jgi:diguanylate cyclase (GGDEF)-like protein
VGLVKAVLQTSIKKVGSWGQPNAVPSDTAMSPVVNMAIKSFTSSPAQIWRSRLSWRILLSVFLTIMAIQMTILALTVKNEEIYHLDNLRETARQTIAPALQGNPSDYLSSPLTAELASRIISSSSIEGIVIYARDFHVVGSFGEPVIQNVANYADALRDYYSVDGSFYEVILRPSEINKGNGQIYQPYYIALRINSENVRDTVRHYVTHSILVMFLLSAFVTTVLMVALGRWLLEPILFMRNNLLEASRNPDNPNIPASPFRDNDEIGSAIKIAQSLIRQNADNIRQVKSAAQDQIHKLAYYDSLTGLPNRILFLQKLGEMTRADKDGLTRRFAVITLDLDHFKDINDTMGHSIGDTILRAVGKRLRSALPESAVVARTGEDEFAVTMPLTSDIHSSKDVAEKVHQVVRSEPFKVFNQSFQVRCSIGVATYPDNGVDPDHVLKNSDIALNRAKEDGRDNIREYLQDFDRVVQQRFQLLNDLREALENNELQLYYQPQLDLKSHKVIGAEALLRWWKVDNSKEGGSFISPAVFVPVAEQSGLMIPMGEWVLRQACKTARGWLDQGIDIRVAVNVSGAQFQQGDLVGYTTRILQETGLPAKNLELEVTESAFMHDVQQTIRTLAELHKMGVELAIDDFGTGYSSLSYLRQFPIDRLKIDQSFIKNALDNRDDASIARTIVALGHSLSLRVIAEGVETKEHEAFLMREGCDEVQGYRYSRPIPNDKFIDFVNGYQGDITTFGD